MIWAIFVEPRVCLTYFGVAPTIDFGLFSDADEKRH